MLMEFFVRHSIKVIAVTHSSCIIAPVIFGLHLLIMHMVLSTIVVRSVGGSPWGISGLFAQGKIAQQNRSTLINFYHISSAYLEI